MSSSPADNTLPLKTQVRAVRRLEADPAADF
jgi:hypothetical protein